MKADEFADKLAMEIWDCWHGPLAKMPSNHAETVEDLLDMFTRIVPEDKTIRF